MALADVFIPAILSTKEAMWVAPPPPPPPSPEPQVKELEDDGLEFCRLSSPQTQHPHMQEHISRYGLHQGDLGRCLNSGDLDPPQYAFHQHLPSFSNIPTSPLPSSPLPSSACMASDDDIAPPPATSAMEASLHASSSSIENSLVLSYPSANSCSSTNLDLISSGYSESCEVKSLDLPPQQRKRKVSMKRKNIDDFGGMDSGLEVSQESSVGGGGGGGGGDAEWVVIDVQPSHPIALKKACPEAPQSGGSLFRNMFSSASSHWGRVSSSTDPSVLASPHTTDGYMQMECEYCTESMDCATTMDVDSTARTAPGVTTETYRFCNNVQPHINGWQHSGIRTLVPPPRDQPRCHSSGEMYKSGVEPTMNGFHNHLNGSSIPSMFLAHFSKSL